MGLFIPARGLWKAGLVGETTVFSHVSKTLDGGGVCVEFETCVSPELLRCALNAASMRKALQKHFHEAVEHAMEREAPPVQRRLEKLWRVQVLEPSGKWNGEYDYAMDVLAPVEVALPHTHDEVAGMSDAAKPAKGLAIPDWCSKVVLKDTVDAFKEWKCREGRGIYEALPQPLKCTLASHLRP